MTRYQRYTGVGQKYLTGIESLLFEQNIDAPPHQVPQFAFLLAAGELDEYVGRVVSVYDDLEQLKTVAANASDSDFYKLRLKK
ncbi:MULTISPECIES: hypothetical protein [Bacillaceae]|uniref:hypothetical protein n=1 Tax=Bacillaceae TaxID=186817 RepID=UPI002FFDFA7F